MRFTFPNRSIASIVVLGLVLSWALMLSCDRESVPDLASVEAEPESEEVVSESATDERATEDDEVAVENGQRDDSAAAVELDDDIVAVSAGGVHSCALRENGAAYCWGDDSHGQTRVPEGRYRAISASPTAPSYHGGRNDEHTCAIDDDGALKCWGGNDVGQAEPPQGVFKEVTTGTGFGCGLRDDGQLRCWGNLENWVESPPEGSFRQIDRHCALDEDGEVHCAYIRDYCARDAEGNRHCDEEVGMGATLAQFGRLEEIVVRHRYGEYSDGFCGRYEDGRVICLGAYHKDYREFASAVPSHRFEALSLGEFQACGLQEDDSLACFGGTGGDYHPSGRYAQVDVGTYHSCGITADGELQCWGDNEADRAEPPQGRYVPREEIVPPPLSELEAGPYENISVGHGVACGVDSEGNIDCWGGFDGTPPDIEARRVSVGIFTSESYQLLNEYPEGGLTEDHACALDVEERIHCWGNDQLGQLDAPKGRFKDIDAGPGYTCAVGEDGRVSCWGDTRFGIGSPPEGEFETVHTAPLYACAIDADGEAICWGHDFSQDDFVIRGLDRDPGETGRPDGPVTDLALTWHFGCGLHEDRSVNCWLADETQTWPSKEIYSPEGTFRAISGAGIYHACGLRSDDTIHCWDYRRSTYNDPPQGSFSALDVGPWHYCAIDEEKVARCWTR